MALAVERGLAHRAIDTARTHEATYADNELRLFAAFTFTGAMQH